MGWIKTMNASNELAYSLSLQEGGDVKRINIQIIRSVIRGSREITTNESKVSDEKSWFRHRRIGPVEERERETMRH